MPKVRAKPMQAPVPMEIPFPVKGIDQSQPRGKQDPLTCVEALNVRGFPPLSDRIGGGKREGTRRAFSDQMTGTGGNRLLGLSAFASAALAVDVPGSSSLSSPSSTVASDGANTYVGAASRHAATDETTPNGDTDYIFFSPFVRFPTVDSECILGMSALSAPAAGSSVTVSVSAKKTRSAGDASSLSNGKDRESFIVYLYQSSTLIATSSDYAADMTADYATFSFNLTDLEIAAISDWTLLRVKIYCLSDGAFVATTYSCSWVQISTTPGPSSTDPTIYVLGTTPSKCYIGNLGTNVISSSATTSATKTEPIITPFRGNTANTSAIRFYLVDGDKSLRILPNGTASPPTVTSWLTDCNTEYDPDNVFPTNCRIVAPFRNRLFLARQEGSSANDSMWYCSASDDPLDWRYGDNDDRPAETSAIAGTNAFTGRPSDAIRALAPWGDDYLIFGCANTLWYMEGDPGLGGYIINLSQQTGMLGGRCWCFDETGTLWFLGSSGLYRLQKGGQPVNVSGRRIYRYLDHIDSAQVQIALVYDAFKKHIRIFATPTESPVAGGTPATTYPVFNTGYAVSFCYDIVNDAFWTDQMPWNPMGPWSVCQIAGASDDNRRFLMGGDDGYIRRPFDGGVISDTQVYGTADDMPRAGTPNTPSSAGNCFAITSSVICAPVEVPLGTRESMVTEIHAAGSDNNRPLSIPIGPLIWRWTIGDSPSSVVDQGETVASGTWFPTGSEYGFQQPVSLRYQGAAHVLTLAQTSATKSWAIDRVTAYFTAGQRRRYGA